MRAVLTVEEDERGRTTLVVTELPSEVSPSDLAEKIANLVKDGTVGGIAEVRDEGSGPDERIVLVLKRDAVTKVVLSNLYQHAQLEPGSAG
jgi:DNA gyrase subunit A